MRVINADAFIDSINEAIKVGSPEQRKILGVILECVEAYANDISDDAERMIEELSDCTGCYCFDCVLGCTNEQCLESRQKAMRYIVKFTGGNKCE